MDQRIVEYLQKNKESYTQGSLVEQLRKSGHSEKDIADAISAVYGSDDGTPPKPDMPNSPNVIGGVRYAGFWIRFLAAIIDGIILLVCIGVVVIPVAMIDPTGLMHTFFGFAIPVTYAILMVDRYQATLGKMAVGVEVCDANTLGKATVGNVAIREVVKQLINSIPFVNIAAAFVIAFTDRKQGIHDFAGKTVVVYKK